MKFEIEWVEPWEFALRVALAIVCGVIGRWM